MAGWGRVARYGEVLRGGTGSRAVGRAWSGCGGAPLQRARAGRAAGALRARCSAPARRQLLAAGGAPGLVWGRRRRHGRSRPSQHAHAPTSGRGAVPGRSVEGPTRKRVCCAIQLGARCPPRPVTARWVSARFLSSSSLIGIDSSAPPAALVAPAPSGGQRSARTPCTFFSRAAAHRYAPLRTPCSCPSRAGADCGVPAPPPLAGSTHSPHHLRRAPRLLWPPRPPCPRTTVTAPTPSARHQRPRPQHAGAVPHLGLTSRGSELCQYHLRPLRACPGLRSQPGAPPSSGSCLHAAAADGPAREDAMAGAAPTERLHTHSLRHTWQARSDTRGRPAPAPAHSLYRALHPPATRRHRTNVPIV